MHNEQPLTADVVICNAKGLHARASARFVNCAAGFQADVTVERDGEIVGGTSILGLISLASGCGTTIRIGASGPDARIALDTLIALVESGFEEN